MLVFVASVFCFASCKKCWTCTTYYKSVAVETDSLTGKIDSSHSEITQPICGKEAYGRWNEKHADSIYYSPSARKHYHYSEITHCSE